MRLLRLILDWKKVRIRTNWLGSRNLNITKYFNRIIKVFEDFKLMQELRGEIEKVKMFNRSRIFTK